MIIHVDSSLRQQATHLYCSDVLVEACNSKLALLCKRQAGYLLAGHQHSRQEGTRWHHFH